LTSIINSVAVEDWQLHMAPVTDRQKDTLAIINLRACDVK